MIPLRPKLTLIITTALCSAAVSLQAIERTDIGVGAKPIDGAEVIIDGSRKMLDEKWTYWEGPRFSSSLPIKWKIVDDPVDAGTVVQTDASRRARSSGVYNGLRPDLGGRVASTARALRFG